MAASVSACLQPQPFPSTANKYSQTGTLKQKNGSLSLSASFSRNPFPQRRTNGQTGALKQKNGSFSECLPSAATLSLNGEQIQPNWYLETEGSLSLSACLQPQPFPPTANKCSQTGALKQKNDSVSECLPSTTTLSLNGEQMQPN